MLPIFDAIASGIAPINLPETSEEESANSLAYRVGPSLDGNLRVDPEIHLPSPGMDVEVSYYYNSNSSYNGLFGYGRTLSANMLVQASGSPLMVTFTRGNGATDLYRLVTQTNSFVAMTSNLRNSLTTFTQGASQFWKESSPEGINMVYPYRADGGITSMTYVEDAVGNRHTHTYDGTGRLQALVDSVGRQVTFSYQNGLLNTIQDWAGRRTSFAYATVAGKPALTTIIGPTGCQTGYGYEVAGTSPNQFPRLVSITDPNGYLTTYSYDNANRIRQRTFQTSNGPVLSRYDYTATQMMVTDALGAVTTNIHDAFYNLVGSVGPVGTAMTYTRGSFGGESARQNSYGAIYTTTYNSTGIPSTNTDPLGHTTTFLRDNYNNATGIIYPNGSVRTLLYGFAGSTFDVTGAKRRLQVEINPSGARTSYSYNGRGQLLGAEDALGNRTTFGYDNLGNRIAVTNALGQITTSVFDAAGNVSGTQDPLGRRATFTYDPQNRLLTSTDPLGQTTTHGYDSSGNETVIIDPLGARTTTTYNVFDRPVSIRNPLGDVTTMVYDALGRSIATVDALGNRTSTVYDADGRVLATIDALGRRTSTLYDPVGRPWATVDALGQRTSTVYDLSGQSIAEIDESGYRTSTSYDVLGRPETTQDALGRVTTTVYDVDGRLLANVNALGYRTTTVYDVASRPIATLDPLGRTLTTVYDALGRVRASINALGNRTTFNYDAAGQETSVQNARGYVSSSIYDGAGRLRVSVDPMGAATTFSYDAASRQVATQDARGYLSTTIYDAAGQALASQSPMGYLSSTVYDALGRAVATVDADGRRTTTLYDAAGQVKAEVNALNFHTSFSYDAVGRSHALEDANGRRTTMNYDARGLLVSQQDGLGRLTSYRYDAVGNTVGKTDARSIVTTVSYDALDRPATALYSTGRQATFLYDAVGQQTVMSDQSGVTSYSYDGVGRVQSVSAPATGTLTYSYDAVGNRTRLSDPDGKLTSYAYDGNDRLTRLQNPFGEVTSYSYDVQGRETQRVYANGMALNLAYDPNGREVYRQVSSGAGVLLVQTPIYGMPGQMLSLSESGSAVGGSSTLVTYGYDDSYQLTVEERAGYSSYFGYDGAGNRLLQVENGVATSYAYDSANQQVQSSSGASVTAYSYDSAGNRTLENANGALTTYTWNEENKIVRLSLPSGEVQSLVYSGEGDLRRRTVAVNGVTQSDVRLLQDGQVVLQEQDAATGVVLRRYSNGGGGWGNLVSLSEGAEGDAGIFNQSLFNAARFNQVKRRSCFFGFDYLGSTRLLLDGAGVLTDTSVPSAFGEQLTATGNTSNLFWFGGNWQYLRLTQSLLLAGERVYDAETGTWLSLDPIGFDSGDFNLFRYVKNNPVHWVDPEGLAQDWGGGSGTVRFSIATYIPYGNVASPGQPPWAGTAFFNGNGRGPSWNSSKYKTEIDFRINLKNHSVVFNPHPPGFTTGTGGSSTGYRGQGAYKPRFSAVRTKCGYRISISGASVIPYYYRNPVTTSTAIRHNIYLDINNNGEVISGSGRHSQFPSLEVWSYRNGRRPHLIYNYDVRATVGNNPAAITGYDTRFSF